jgi:glutathione S-transferase
MVETIFSVNVPSDYGYVVLAVGVGSFIVPTLMGGAVMKARKEFDVQYPNLYATPGYHKKADEFNRVQRGHQNMFESLSSVSIMTLLGGIQYPRINAGGYVLYLLGSHFYLKGYADTTLDVKMARYQRGGGIKWIGVLCSLVSTVSLGGSMLGWW